MAQRYQPLGHLGDDNDVVDGNESRGSPFDGSGTHPQRAELNGERMLFEGGRSTTPDSLSLQQSFGSSNRMDHPLQNGGEATDNGSDNLRLRRQQGSQEKKVMVLEDTIASHLEGQLHHLGNTTSTPPRPARLTYDKNSNTEVSSSSDEEEDEEYDAEANHIGGSRGEDQSGLNPASHASSFDLLDDEDEINLQRYHRDFGATPYNNDYHDDLGWDSEYADNTSNMYHPRTESSGSHSKDPWIRMVQQQNQQSPTHGGQMSLSSIHSLADVLLYLQGVRRQARQRRAQRLLTMPSEQWSERLQFFVMTYCWDATDVGLLVVAVLIVVWFTGLLWLARMKAREEDAGTSHNGNGAEYNGNAEFDEYEQEGRSWRLIVQWWWRALGLLLLVRILGPFAVQNVNNRRRERRRQRFMSGNMQDQQRRMQQQQLPTIMHAGNGEFSDNGKNEPQSYNTSMASSQDDTASGVEITGRTLNKDSVEDSVANSL